MITGGSCPYLQRHASNIVCRKLLLVLWFGSCATAAGGPPGCCAPYGRRSRRRVRSGGCCGRSSQIDPQHPSVMSTVAMPLGLTRLVVGFLRNCCGRPCGRPASLAWQQVQRPGLVHAADPPSVGGWWPSECVAGLGGHRISGSRRRSFPAWGLAWSGREWWLVAARAAVVPFLIRAGWSRAGGCLALVRDGGWAPEVVGWGRWPGRSAVIGIASRWVCGASDDAEREGTCRWRCPQLRRGPRAAAVQRTVQACPAERLPAPPNAPAPGVRPRWGAHPAPVRRVAGGRLVVAPVSAAVSVVVAGVGRWRVVPGSVGRGGATADRPRPRPRCRCRCGCGCARPGAVRCRCARPGAVWGRGGRGAPVPRGSGRCAGAGSPSGTGRVGVG